MIAGVVLGLDLWSKHWAFSTLAPDEIHTFIPGFLEFRRSLNDGAVFGSLTGQTGLFITASLLALVFVFYLFAFSWRTQWGLHIALALILSGAMGNLYDRAYVKADVVRYQADSDRQVSIIGTIVSSDPDSRVIRIGNWPDGRYARTFPTDEVSVHRQGVVRDFLKFAIHFPTWIPFLGQRDVWPWIFNVADVALVCGVGVLLIHTRRDRKNSRSSP